MDLVLHRSARAGGPSSRDRVDHDTRRLDREGDSRHSGPRRDVPRPEVPMPDVVSSTRFTPLPTECPTESATPRPPISDDLIRRMHAWWRAANYLSVGGAQVSPRCPGARTSGRSWSRPGTATPGPGSRSRCSSTGRPPRSLRRLHARVFTGGIGEHAASIRRAIAARVVGSRGSAPRPAILVVEAREDPEIGAAALRLAARPAGRRPGGAPSTGRPRTASGPDPTPERVRRRTSRLTRLRVPARGGARAPA